MTTVSQPAAPPAPVRPTGPGDVLVVLLLVAAELVLAWYSYDIARFLVNHLDSSRLVGWLYLALPCVPLAVVVSLHAIRPTRAPTALLAALGVGALAIAQSELLRWLITDHPDLNRHVFEIVGYVFAMTVATLASLAWGLSRRHGRTWAIGLLVAAVGTALTLWTNWPVHTSWSHWSPLDSDAIRRWGVLMSVAQMLPIVAACVVCWLIDVAEVPRPAVGSADDEGPPPR